MMESATRARIEANAPARWLALAAMCSFLTLALLVPLAVSETGSNTLSIKEPILQMGAALSFVLLLASAPGAARRIDAPVAAALALGLTLIASAMWQGQHPRAWLETIRWGSYLLVFLGMRRAAQDPKTASRFVFILLVSSSVACLYAFIQALELEAWIESWFGKELFIDFDSFTPEGSDIRRVCSSLCNPDFLAGWLVGVIPLFLAFAWNSLGFARAAFAALALMHFAALFLTYSRGGWAAALASLLIFWAAIAWSSYKRNGGASIARQSAIAVAAIIVLAAAGWFMMPEEMRSGWQDRFSGLSTDLSIQSRMFYYQTAVAMWLDAPLTGQGIGMYSIRFYDFCPDDLGALMNFRRFHIEYTHNEWLQILAETGGIGFLLYASLLALCFIATTRRTERQPFNAAVLWGAAIGASAILIHNLFTVTLRYPPSAYLLWAFLGLMAAHARPISLPAFRSRAVRYGFVLILLLVSTLVYARSLDYYVADVGIQSAKKAMYEELKPENSREQNREVMEGALVTLHRAFNLAPSRVDALSYIGLAYNKSLDYIQSRDAYLRQHQLHPNFTSVLMNLSVNQLQWAELLNKPVYYPPGTPLIQSPMEELISSAVEWAERGASLDPSDPVYPHLSGRGYYFLDEWDEAARCFNRAIENARAISEHMYRSEIADSEEKLRIIENAQAARGEL